MLAGTQSQAAAMQQVFSEPRARFGFMTTIRRSRVSAVDTQLGRMGGPRFATGTIPSRLEDLRRNLTRLLLLPERRPQRAYPRAVKIESNSPRKRSTKRATKKGQSLTERHCRLALTCT